MRSEKMRDGFKILTGKATCKTSLGKPMSRWKTILKWILQKSGEGKEVVAGTCEHGNETSGSVKHRDNPDQLSDYYPPEKTAPRRS